MDVMILTVWRGLTVLVQSWGVDSCEDIIYVRPNPPGSEEGEFLEVFFIIIHIK